MDKSLCIGCNLVLHLKLARVALGITQDQLVEKSFVSAQTIKKIETTSPNEKLKSNKSTLIALMRFFEDQGIKFVDGDNIGIKISRNIMREKF